MFRFEIRRSLNGFGLLNVFHDSFDFLRIVSQGLKSKWNRPVDDLHHPSSGQLLVFDQGNIGLDAGCVTIHHECDCPGRSQHSCLSIPVTKLTP